MGVGGTGARIGTGIDQPTVASVGLSLGPRISGVSGVDHTSRIARIPGDT
jgi:hypothetical protein